MERCVKTEEQKRIEEDKKKADEEQMKLVYDLFE